MTVGDMPLASATPSVGADSPRVLTRVRARLSATLRDVKVPAAVRSGLGVVGADVRRWWAFTAAPPSLAGWLAARKPLARRVPQGNRVLRAVWLVDNWATGSLFDAVSVLLFAAAGALRWAAGHPLRRWAFLLFAAATGLWLALA